MRYLSQRYAMPYKECKATLTDIGTEELAHLEIVAAIVHQLTRNLTAEELVEQGFGPYYIDHTTGIWPQSAGGVPFNACEFQSKGDVITDLHEDMAAEQKARSTYDNILRVVKDYDVCEPIRFLREREIVHYQRFGASPRRSWMRGISMPLIRLLTVILCRDGRGRPTSCNSQVAGTVTAGSGQFYRRMICPFSSRASSSWWVVTRRKRPARRAKI